MTLTKAAIELRFKSVNPVFNWRGSLLKVITGKAANSLPPLNEGLSIEIKDIEGLLVVEPNRWVISLNKIQDEASLLKHLYALSVKLNSTMTWGKSFRIGFRTVWIQDVSTNFDEATDALKTKLFKDIPLVQDAQDIGLPLTLEDGDSKVNFQFGIMKKEQLINVYFQDQKEKELPEISYTLDLDYFRLAEENFTNKDIRRFSEKALAFSKATINKIQEQILNV